MSQLSHAQFPLRRHPRLLVDHRRARTASVADSRGADGVSHQQLRWPASFRNGGRLQIGTVAGFKSESVAGLRRNSHIMSIEIQESNIGAHRALAGRPASNRDGSVLRKKSLNSPYRAPNFTPMLSAKRKISIVN